MLSSPLPHTVAPFRQNGQGLVSPPPSVLGTCHLALLPYILAAFPFSSVVRLFYITFSFFRYTSCLRPPRYCLCAFARSDSASDLRLTRLFHLSSVIPYLIRLVAPNWMYVLHFSCKSHWVAHITASQPVWFLSPCVLSTRFVRIHVCLLFFPFKHFCTHFAWRQFMQVSTYLLIYWMISWALR